MPWSKEIKIDMYICIIHIYKNNLFHLDLFVWKGLQNQCSDSGTQSNQSESHDPQIEKTWNSDEHSQECINRWKEPRLTSKKRKASPNHISYVYDSTIRVTGQKWHPCGCLTFVKIHLNSPQDFVLIFCGTMSQMWNSSTVM